MTRTAQTSHRDGPCGRKRQTPTLTRLSKPHWQHEFPGEVHQLVHTQSGKVLRTHMNMAISAKSFAKNQRYDGIQLRKENGADHPPRNSVIASPLIANMPIYSPRKNSANLNPEYSM